MTLDQPAAGARPHVLFVDDEAPIRELLALYFHKKGLQVTTAVTCQDAKALSKLAAYDLVILDLHLAEENGLDLLGYFKREYPKLPVIIFTGMGSDQGLIARTREGGADAFMSKSESLGVLFAQVLQLLLQSASAAPKRAVETALAAKPARPQRPPSRS